jgi:serine/threonine-protein kinase
MRADLFSFGVVLHEMLTGMLPFKGNTADEVLESIITHQPASVTRLNPNVPG